MAQQTAQVVGLGPYGNFYGSLPDSFGFKSSQLNPAANANPITGTNAFGVPGIAQPQSSNVVVAPTVNAQVTAASQVQSGPTAQPAYIALVSMVIGVFFLAVLAHVETR